MTEGPEEQRQQQREDEEPAVAPAQGGISIGVLTGGAVAAGEGATAEDRSRRAGGRAEPPPSPAMTPRAAPGGIAIGVMTAGAAAAGPGANALDASEEPVGVSAEFRTALGTLREQLRLLSPSDETAELDAGLAGAEEEIGATGQVRRERLWWLRERLDVGATAAAGLASAAAVVQQITQLLAG